MKISKTKLHQIIREEARTIVEAPDSLGRHGTEPMTRFEPRRVTKRKQRRDQDRDAVKDFFGSDDPLVTKAEDPNKTVALSPKRRAAIAAGAERSQEPKQAEDRPLNDPQRISITDFSRDVQEEILADYEVATDIEIDPTPLGSGEFGIVYKGENPEYGPVAVKITLSGQEINAYRNIQKLKDGLESRDPQAGNVLPTILDIRTVPSEPVVPEGEIRRGKFVKSPSGQRYKVFVVQMELLDKLDPDTRSDIFGPAPMDAYPPEVRERFVEDYLSIENIYSALAGLLGEDHWEDLMNSLIRDPGPVAEGAGSTLPIVDKRAFPVFKVIDSVLPRLRTAYLEADAENHFFALKDIHRILAQIITKAFRKYSSNERLLGRLESVAGFLLPQQMAANSRLPQYDPAKIKASPGLRSAILPPTAIQSRVAKNFYKRLKKLEKWDAQYGDVHANNLMQRANGDLVVADVGLFLFGPEDSRGYAGHKV
tara:strand:- start:1403 stop:2845 length:1443 start_codon:yes stop_codon:yes gene_type:complete